MAQHSQVQPSRGTCRAAPASAPKAASPGPAQGAPAPGAAPPQSGPPAAAPAPGASPTGGPVPAPGPAAPTSGPGAAPPAVPPSSGPASAPSPAAAPALAPTPQPGSPRCVKLLIPVCAAWQTAAISLRGSVLHGTAQSGTTQPWQLQGSARKRTQGCLARARARRTGARGCTSAERPTCGRASTGSLSHRRPCPRAWAGCAHVWTRGCASCCAALIRASQRALAGGGAFSGSHPSARQPRVRQATYPS